MTETTASNREAASAATPAASDESTRAADGVATSLASGESTRAATLRAFAEELLAADRDKAPVAPLRERLEGMTIEDAYEVQTQQLDAHLATGRTVVGRKVGLTSLAMQQQLGVDSPDFGYVLDNMRFAADARIPVSQFISPKVEPEFAFVLKQDLVGPGVTVAEAREAIGEIYPAIEIIDSRVRDWDIRLVDTIADNASCGAIAVGETPLDLAPSDLSDVECSLVISGDATELGREVREEAREPGHEQTRELARELGRGDAVMGDPVAPLAWLANVLGERGVTLEKGQVILPGSFTKALPVVQGQSATADFGTLGALTIHFD